MAIDINCILFKFGWNFELQKDVKHLSDMPTPMQENQVKSLGKDKILKGSFKIMRKDVIKPI